jgi:deazaflavin-dependent oxidoreductase (nitroreductase family)
MSGPQEPPRPSSLGDDLTTWGRTLALETSGRTSGQVRRVTIGFVEAPDGSLLVAASAQDTHWAQNLTIQPRCTVERAGERRECVAVPIDGDVAQDAVRALIIKYGTPAERLGAGPVFQLVPLARVGGR